MKEDRCYVTSGVLNDIVVNMFHENILWDAKKFAFEKHKGQRRKDEGKPYIVHPLRVSSIIEKLTHSIELQVAAILHDLVEDSDVTIKDIEKKFNKRIASLVQELSTDGKALDKLWEDIKKEIKQEDLDKVDIQVDNDQKTKRLAKSRYLLNKMLGMSDDALTIKLADRLDNITSAIRKSQEKFREAYKWETRQILTNLEKQRALTQNQQFLADAIKKII